MRTQDIVDHLEKLMVLEPISETGSIRQASEVIGISQPSLSVKVKSIENILGLQLFQRSQSGIQLTQQGQKILDFVKRTQKNADELRMQLESRADTLNGHVRIGIYDSIARYFWPKFYKKLKKKYPGISIALVTGRSHEIMNKLSRQELEIALTVEPNAERGFFQKTLYSDYFSFYANTSLTKDSTAYKKKRGYLELVPKTQKQDLILFSQAMKNYESVLTGANIRTHEVESFEIALEFCLQGIGIAILPHRVANQDLEKKRLRKIKLSSQIPLDFNSHKIVLSVNKQAKSEPATAAIFDEI